MAQMQPFYSWAIIILAVITCHGIVSAQGRQLKPMMKTVSTTKDKFLPPSTRSMEYASTVSAEPINDFRPTTPGNSPGVGHSHAEHSVVVVQPNEAGDDMKLLTKESKQEFKSKQKAYYTVGNSVDGFRPTAPGNSPGVGHSYTKNDVKVQHKGVGIGTPGVGHSDDVGSTDDFKPTQPAGHKNTEPNA